MFICEWDDLTSTSGESTNVNPTTTQQSTQPSSSTDTSSNSNPSTVTPKAADSTTATTILPNTGEKTLIFVAIFVALVSGVFGYFYFVKFRDVK